MQITKTELLASVDKVVSNKIRAYELAVGRGGCRILLSEWRCGCYVAFCDGGVNGTVRNNKRIKVNTNMDRLVDEINLFLDNPDEYGGWD